MISLNVIDSSIKELLQNNEVNVVIHGCNCFHNLVGPVAETLKEATDGDIAFVDENFSQYGDINNLGTWTNQTYDINGSEVEIYNLYCQYTELTDGNDPVHWESLYTGLLDILSQIESGCSVAISKIGHNANSQVEFTLMLNNLLKDEDELPDINVIVVEH